MKKTNKDIAKRMMIENMVTIALTGILFIFTFSPWVFLLLLNLNRIRYKDRNSESNNCDKEST